MSTNDYRVAPSSPWEVADAAAQWRRMDATTVDANGFDITTFLVRTVLPALAKWGRVIELELIDADEREKGWVDFKRGALCIRRDVWKMAQRGDPRARLVIAHEIGHLVLHRNQTYAFTRGYEYKLNYLEAFESAECQANWFGWALLLPDYILLALMGKVSTDAIAILSMVEERLVTKRLEQLQLDKRYRSNFSGDVCPQCDNFTVVRVGLTLTCTTCGLGIASS